MPLSTDEEHAGPSSICSDCWRALLSWMYDSYAVRCLRCGAVRLIDEIPCRRCSGTIFDETDGKHICCGPYRGDGKTLLVAYKFHGRKGLAQVVAALFEKELKSIYGTAPLCLIPVPSSLANRKRRGWDQMELVCFALAKNEGWFVVPALERQEGGTEQKTLTRGQRLAQARLGFRVGSEGIRGLRSVALRSYGVRFIVVDDVCTTGATLRACRASVASVLEKMPGIRATVDELSLCEA
ncbi:MAG: ComF family protein [Sphaerochaetaceae bacterium]